MNRSICMAASLLCMMLLTGCDTQNETHKTELANNAPSSSASLTKPEALDNKVSAHSAEPADVVSLPLKNVTKEQVAHLKQQVLDLIEVKSANNVAACAVIAAGHKSCGGPKEYLAYSKEQSDETALKHAVNAYSQADMQYQLENKMMSTCEVTPKQYPVLLDGQCGLTLEPAATY